MFSSSSQIKYWTFSGTTELDKMRAEANRKFIEKHGAQIREQNPDVQFLTAEEETKVRRHYEYVLKEVCQKFHPPMPRYVLGTAMAYFKRIYIHTSVMDYTPKDMVHTSIYLACKVEEFNVSIQQYVQNLKSSEPERESERILAQELLLMHLLHYHLTVHNPFRPLEGLLIDIKTRCPDVSDAECLRKGAEEFLDRALNTDVGMVFAPSQVALAAVLASAKNIGVSIDSYVANKLLSSGGQENLTKTVEHVKRIRYKVRNQEPLYREEVREIEHRLHKCRNPENNPDSDIYKRKLEDRYSEATSSKRAKKDLFDDDFEGILSV